MSSRRALAINDSVYLIVEGIPLRMKYCFQIVLTIAWHRINVNHKRVCESKIFLSKNERLRCRCDKFCNIRKRWKASVLVDLN